MKQLIAILVLTVFITVACAAPPAENAPATSLPEPTEPPPTESPTTPQTEEEPTLPSFSMELTSPEFEEGKMMPEKFGCKGAEVSPPLNWTEPPAGTQSFALIMEDPDAPLGTWVHWVLYNIPADARSLPENVPDDPILADGSKHGKNSWPSLNTRYGGPCPPSGIHRYFFNIYALDITLPTDPALTKEELLSLIEGHILGEGQLMGRYRH